jgi:hypothetical protein
MIINPNIHRAALPSRRTRRGPSRITIPQKANPLARLVFAEMQRQNISYEELEHLSGVLHCTTKAWRGENSPGLLSISAALGALGWNLVPVPVLDVLPDQVRDALDEIGQHFRSDEETYGAALQAAAVFPAYARERLAKARSGASKPEERSAT